MNLATRVLHAQADAWAAQARLRPGGATAELPGARLAASGLPHPQHNGADLTDARLVDEAAVARWFADHDVPWAWRVPAARRWDAGQLVITQRLMGLEPASFRPAPLPADVELRIAGEADADAVVGVDLAAFGGSEAPARAWLAGLLAASERGAVAAVALATWRGEPVATAYAVHSAERAGPAALLAGVAVLPAARRRGIGAAISSWLLARAFTAGAALAHLQPDDERAARVYRRLGFTEVPGLQIRSPSPIRAPTPALGRSTVHRRGVPEAP
ncbi:GNAT family N-acetyltransferase [Modestobacter versicolor]|uniref:GNAT family N-acetyltransferase n=1 Tax=Modestobacter versicolor TaxID=429133 RepID=UPI0034DE236D